MRTPNCPALPKTESVAAVDDLPAALARLGLGSARPVLVSVGGAGGLDAVIAEHLLVLFRDRLAPLLNQLGAAVVDGGTDAGVMSLMGEARRAAGAEYPLLGVAARGTVRLPGEPTDRGAALEPNHSHRLLVPGHTWGDEIPWMNAVAALLSADCGSATLVSSGGRITACDVDASLAHGRSTLLLANSGGTADAIARAGVRHPLVQVVSSDNGWCGLDSALQRLLGAGTALGRALRPDLLPDVRSDAQAGAEDDEDRDVSDT